jgi:predicted molibdopterin-dependent oxidoreductase YjgC
LILDANAHPWLSTGDAVSAVGDRKTAVLARTHSPLVETASIVLPLASWAETEGSYTSSTGRVQIARRAFSPRGQARPPWEVVYRLAVALGIEQLREVSPKILFAEMAPEVAAFSGMTWRRLAAKPGMPLHEEVSGVG